MNVRGCSGVTKCAENVNSLLYFLLVVAVGHSVRCQVLAPRIINTNAPQFTVCYCVIL